MVEEMLKCGSLDIQMLDKCEYDYDDIKSNIDYLRVEDIDINTILASCIDFFISNIQYEIENKINETESDLKELERYIDENNGNVDIKYVEDREMLEQELEELQSLNAYDDIEYYTNYLDTSVYIVDRDTRELYSKYLKEEVEKENERLGFCYLDLY